MEHITLDKIWGVLVEVKTNLQNHLTDHNKREDRWFRISIVLLSLLGIAIISYFIK